MKINIFKSSFTKKILSLIILIIIWEVIAKSSMFETSLFPDVGSILNALIVSFTKGNLLEECIFSLKIITIGMIIGLLGAVLLVYISRTSSLVNSFVETLAAIAHPLPGIALLPLIILWIGTGYGAILFIIVHSVLWPLYINLNSGLKSIPKIYQEIGKNIGLNTIQESIHVILPGSLTYILSGIRIGWARAWRALISAEMIFGAAGGRGGLGWYIFQKRIFMDTQGLFAGLFIIILIGIFVEDIVLEKIEKMTIKKWQLVK